MTFFMLVVWVLSVVVGVSVAQQRGQSVVAAAFLTVPLGPIGLIVVLLWGTNTGELRRRALETQQARACPACAELVRLEATKCRYCGTELTPQPQPQMFPATLRSEADTAAAKAKGRRDVGRVLIVSGLVVGALSIHWSYRAGYRVAPVSEWPAKISSVFTGTPTDPHAGTANAADCQHGVLQAQCRRIHGAAGTDETISGCVVRSRPLHCR